MKFRKNFDLSETVRALQGEAGTSPWEKGSFLMSDVSLPLVTWDSAVHTLWEPLFWALLSPFGFCSEKCHSFENFLPFVFFVLSLWSSRFSVTGLVSLCTYHALLSLLFSAPCHFYFIFSISLSHFPICYYNFNFSSHNFKFEELSYFDYSFSSHPIF